MSSWRVAQHYGLGAARIPIHVEPHVARRLTLAEGFADLRSEFVAGGRRAMIRRVVGQSPVIVLCVLLASTFLVTLLRDPPDDSAIEIVFFDPATPATATTPVVPEIVPEIIPEKKRAEPIPLALRPPPEPAKELAPPLEPPKSRPKSLPRVMPRLARVAPPSAPPASLRPRHAPRVRSRQTLEPRIELDIAAPRSVSPARKSPSRTQRIVNLARPGSARVPRLDAPAAPSLAVVDESPRPRGFRVAALAPNAARSRMPAVTPALAPSPGRVTSTEPVPPSRVRVERPRARDRRANVASSLAAAPVPATSSDDPIPDARRGSDRQAPRPPAGRGPRPPAEFVRAPTRSRPSSLPAAAARVDRMATRRFPSGADISRPGLAGVPLGELAVCRTDREEDRLKQAVVAAVTTQEECASRSGTYRFVETKNLNSFLMWIDHRSGRAVGDRCDELRNALDCLHGPSARQHAAR